LQKNIELSERRTTLLNAELDLLKSQEELLKLKGESTKENIEQQNILLAKLRAEALFRLNTLQTQLNSLNATINHITLMEKLNLLFGVSPVSDEDLKKAEELRLKILETQKLLTDISKEIEGGGAAAGAPILDADGRPIDVTSESQTTSDRERSLREQIEGVSEIDPSSVTSVAVDLQTETNRQLAELAEQRLRQEKGTAAASVLIAELEAEAKRDALFAYAGALSEVSAVLGQETAAGKALAVASSLINTYSAITGQLSAFSKVPIPGFAIAQAIATGLVGFANVKNILKVQVPGEGGSSSTNAPQPAAPSFNVVGTSGVNQIAQSLAQQDEPIQAFVVGSNVTTQQALDRNIVTTATIG